MDTANTTQGAAATRRKPFYKDMSVQVFAGMLVGAAIGHFWPQSADFMSTLGELFIRLIAMFVGLIIFCAVVHGIATVREAKRVGRVAIRALIYFEVVTTFALIIGLTAINVLAPGKGAHFDLSGLPTHALDAYQHTAETISAGGFFLSIVPHTALSAFTDGNVLAGRVPVRAVCLRPARGRRARPADGRHDRDHQAHGVQDHRLHHVARADRRHGGDRGHRRQIRHRLADDARRAGRRVLSHLRSVHRHRAVADRVVERHQPLVADPLYPYRASGRVRHELFRIRFSAARAKAHGARLR